MARELIVPTLCVGMHSGTLRVRSDGVTQSVIGGIPTQSVGTIKHNPKTLYETSCLPTLGDASDFSCKILGRA